MFQWIYTYVWPTYLHIINTHIGIDWLLIVPLSEIIKHYKKSDRQKSRRKARTQRLPFRRVCFQLLLIKKTFFWLFRLLVWTVCAFIFDSCLNMTHDTWRTMSMTMRRLYKVQLMYFYRRTRVFFWYKYWTRVLCVRYHSSDQFNHVIFDHIALIATFNSLSASLSISQRLVHVDADIYNVIRKHQNNTQHK